MEIINEPSFQLFDQKTISYFRNEFTPYFSILKQGNNQRENWLDYFKTSFLEAEALKVQPTDGKPPYNSHKIRLFKEEDSWGAIVSLRVNPRTQKRFCYLEHWFVNDPTDLDEMLKKIYATWNLPSDGIKFHIPSAHPLVKTLNFSKGITLLEKVFIKNWKEHISKLVSSLDDRSFKVIENQNFNEWWPEFKIMFKLDHLCQKYCSDFDLEEMYSCLSEMNPGQGYYINLIDHKGLLGHISWDQIEYKELLFSNIWLVNFIFVRPDSRRQEIGTFLYELMGQKIKLNHVQDSCAIVAPQNLSSLNLLSKMGFKESLNYYIYK